MMTSAHLVAVKAARVAAEYAARSFEQAHGDNHNNCICQQIKTVCFMLAVIQEEIEDDLNGSIVI